MATRLGILTPNDLASELGVSTRTLTTWRTKGGGPDFFRMGNSAQANVRYRESDVIAWLNRKVIAERIVKPSWEAFVRSILTPAAASVCSRLLLWFWEEYRSQHGLKLEPGMPKFRADIQPAVHRIFPGEGGYGTGGGVNTFGGIRLTDGLSTLVPKQIRREFLTARAEGLRKRYEINEKPEFNPVEFIVDEYMKMCSYAD